jgi:YidC/Oxa1 family membrane protein insertase
VRLLADVPVIQPLINFFEWFLLRFHNDLGLGWGTSIVALTILVRALLLPLTFKQFHSMQRLAHLQPEMKKLQERFKGDKERMNQEMMKFYRENKVNPFASCLPMVAQFPVFISLYYMLRIDLRHDICPEINPAGIANPQPCGPTGESSFLFINDLTDKATGSTLVILIVLYVGSQLFSTLLMSTTTDKTQKYIFMALPFVFVTFVIQFPAGLLVYWITTNLWTIVQQAIIRKRLGPLRPPTPEGEKEPSLFDSFRTATAGGAGDGKSVSTKVKGPSKPSGNEPKGRPAGPPPSSPRKKKKRSGRRR